MPTDPVDLIARGMSAEQAVEVATQIDGGADVKRLMGLGVPQATASELAAQITAGETTPDQEMVRLMAVGIPHGQAEFIVAAIAAANA